MDPEEVGEFSHEHYKDRVDGRYHKTRRNIKEIVKLVKESNLKNKDRFAADIASIAVSSFDDGSTEE